MTTDPSSHQLTELLDRYRGSFSPWVVYLAKPHLRVRVFPRGLQVRPIGTRVTKVTLPELGGAE